jgi:hypothetical protein
MMFLTHLKFAQNLPQILVSKKEKRLIYAIFKNGVPIIFIEAKSVTENLKKHDSQLSRYFNAIPEVRIGILQTVLNISSSQI